jgi:hypothetical protein
MSDLQTRYTELQSAGRVPPYCYKQATVTRDKAHNVQIALGLQPNRRYLNLADLDSHKAEQDVAAPAPRVKLYVRCVPPSIPSGAATMPRRRDRRTVGRRNRQKPAPRVEESW